MLKYLVSLRNVTIFVVLRKTNKIFRAMEKIFKQFDLCTLDGTPLTLDLVIVNERDIVISDSTSKRVFTTMFENGLEYANISRRIISIFDGRYESEIYERALLMHLPKGRDVRCDITAAQVRGGFFDGVACDYVGEEEERLKVMQASPYFREFRNVDPGYLQRAKYVLGYENDELPEVIYEFMNQNTARPDLFTPAECPRWYRKMRKEVM